MIRLPAPLKESGNSDHRRQIDWGVDFHRFVSFSEMLQPGKEAGPGSTKLGLHHQFVHKHAEETLMTRMLSIILFIESGEHPTLNDPFELLQL